MHRISYHPRISSRNRVSGAAVSSHLNTQCTAFKSIAARVVHVHMQNHCSDSFPNSSIVRIMRNIFVLQFWIHMLKQMTFKIMNEWVYWVMHKQV
jgi:hypothetical protein